MVAPAEKVSLLVLSLTASSSSHHCLVSLILGTILRHSGLLLDIYTEGGVDPVGVFPLFLKMVANIIAPKLSIIFCGLIRDHFQSVGSLLM